MHVHRYEWSTYSSLQTLITLNLNHAVSLMLRNITSFVSMQKLKLQRKLLITKQNLLSELLNTMNCRICWFQLSFSCSFFLSKLLQTSVETVNYFDRSVPLTFITPLGKVQHVRVHVLSTNMSRQFAPKHIKNAGENTLKGKSYLREENESFWERSLLLLSIPE